MMATPLFILVVVAYEPNKPNFTSIFIHHNACGGGAYASSSHHHHHHQSHYLPANSLQISVSLM